jgi:predicted regulator of Ras-like GTPase activity (Roadblock/LC7/MglB family)
MTENPVQQIASQHISQIAGVTGGVVLSVDGLCMYATDDYDTEAAEKLAALACAKGNLARATSAELGYGAVQQDLTEMKEGFLIIAAAGPNAYVALLTGPRIDLGVVAYEVALLTKRLANVLQAQERTPAPAAQGGASE